jgi:hypothetical protein
VTEQGKERDDEQQGTTANTEQKKIEREVHPRGVATVRSSRRPWGRLQRQPAGATDSGSEGRHEWLGKNREDVAQLGAGGIERGWEGDGKLAGELELCGGGSGRRKERRGPTAWLK